MSSSAVPKIFLAGGAFGFAYYLMMRQYWFPNPYKTREIQNIEDRYTAGGGAPDHQPGTATERGNPSQDQPLGQDRKKGVET